MAKNHTIKCTISAQDGASAVLGRVRASTIALGTAAGALLARGMVAGMNAVRGLVSSVLEAEKANVMLDAALRGVGSYTPEVAKNMRDLASAIQDETGASDESIKSNIAMLTTMGISSEKMGGAARAVSALTSLGREGALSVMAVGRALAGDIAGFERFAPEVKNATTLTEKYAAANKLLAAGYEQQKANLLTVGGSWAALKGRIGDAVEDIGNALTEGLKIGPMFDDMQAAVGKFLQSDTFKSFTDRLRDGADYVSQIVKAMGTDGGTKEVASAIGNVILAAFQDGAEYVGVKISNAFSGAKSIFGETRVKLATMAGTDEAEARKVVYGDKATYKGGNLEEALKNVAEIVNRRVPVEVQTTETSDEYLATMNQLKGMAQEEVYLESGMLKAMEEEAITAETKLQKDIAIDKAKSDILAATEKERDAQDKLAIAARKKDRANVGIEEWINNQKNARDAANQQNKEETAASKKASRMNRKLESGRELSKQDAQWLADFNRRGKVAGDALAAEKQAKVEIAAAKKEQKDAQDRLEKVQNLQLTELQNMNKNLTDNLAVQ